MAYTELFKLYINNSNEKEACICALEKYFPKGKFKNLLDIGCGTGALLKPLFGRFERIVGIDKKNRLDVMSENFDFFEIDFLDFKTDEKFDFVMANYLLWEIPFQKWNEVFNKVNDLLKPNGQFVVIDAYSKIKYDNPFFPFNIGLTKKTEYINWYTFLKSQGVKYKSYSFISKVWAENAEEMYTILKFFFMGVDEKKIYKKNRKKILNNINNKKNHKRLDINMTHMINFISFDR